MFPRETDKFILACLLGAITLLDIVSANSNLGTKMPVFEESLNEKGRQWSQHTNGSEKQAGVRDNLFKQHTRPRYPARGPGQVWDDVIMGFQTSMLEKTSDVTAPGDQEQCQEDLSRVFLSAVSQAPWALQLLDSWGKPGAGLFKSKPSFYGDFDTCIGLEPPENFTTQYCTVSVSAKKLGDLPLNVEFALGLCLPSTCTGGGARTLINGYILTVPNVSMTFGAISCQPRSQELSDKAIAVIVVLSMLAAIMLVGTTYDVMVVRGYVWELTGSACYTSEEASGPEQMSGCGTDSTTRHDAIGEYRPLLVSRHILLPGETDVNYQPGWLGKFFLSFSVRSNGAKLLALKTGSGTITCVNGIRFYSLTWVVLGHSFSMGKEGKANLVEYIALSSQNWTFQGLANGFVAVDSFFVLSGLLMAYLVMKELDKTRSLCAFFGKFYFHRYWRLTPPYMLVMMAYIPLFKYIGDGPVWPINGLEPDECEDRWWTNMLYISNLVKDEKLCMHWSWYLDNDMQFFLVSPLIFMPLFYFGKKGLLAPGVMLLGSAVCAGVITKVNGFGTDATIKGPDFRRIYYIKPYNRIGAYIVGTVTGWLLYKTRCEAKLHWLWVICGWLWAGVLGLSVLYGLSDQAAGHPLTNDVAALYNALRGCAWGLAVSWVIFACASGYGGPINRFLSWPWLLPLSRLTYCAYLVHPLVIQYFFRTQRQLFYCNNRNLTFAYLAILVMSFLLSFVASMAFESPFLGLEKMVLAAVGRVSSVLSPPIKRLVAGRKDGGRGEAQYFDRFSNEAGDGLIP